MLESMLLQICGGFGTTKVYQEYISFITAVVEDVCFFLNNCAG